MSRILLLGAGGPPGENFCRAVQMAGHEVIGCDPDSWGLELSSADMKVQTEAPTTVESLSRLVAEHEPDLIHAQPEQEVQALSQIGPWQDLGHLIFVPDPGTVNVCLDKFATAKRLDDLAPRSIEIGGTLTFAPSARALGIPFWMRARHGAGSKAALLVHDPGVANAWAVYWKSRSVQMMASEYLPGRILSWTGVYADGECVASATKERIALLGTHGSPASISSTARVQRIVKRPDVAQIAREAVSRVAQNPPKGVFMVDLREDGDGNPLVTEINAGRFGTTSLFFAEAGGNLPAAYVAAALGESLPCSGEDVCEIGAVQVRNVDMGSRVTVDIVGRIQEPVGR